MTDAQDGEIIKGISCDRSSSIVRSLATNHPENASSTLPFRVLLTDLFTPLHKISRQSAAKVIPRAKVGPHGPVQRSVKDQKRNVIERFIARWRREVGNDIYPAFRLIIPDKDRDRPMYGLKEKAIGRLLVKVMKIDKSSEDGSMLMNWKIPGRTMASRLAGDFPGRCFDVLSKRPAAGEHRILSIEEVNQLLDQLAATSKEEKQLLIMRYFYENMNAEELTWLIRMILRQMKVGATEKTFFEIWHPDADSLFNMSSSLRRVCWELCDPQCRLLKEDTGVAIMSCFRPQLAQFQMHDFEKMIVKMQLQEQIQTFWIEEKLDGERMQLHMQPDRSVEGGRRFGFWSRRAKEYTYLYGEGLHSSQAALTIHLKDAFREGVESVILDGEMITWDPEQDAMVPFGTLKSAALSELSNPFVGGHRPLMKVFDIVYLNGHSLINYPLKERRKALEASIEPVPRRLEIHDYTETDDVKEIEPRLMEVIAQASEGLVLKNPESIYRLNERNDDWIKVKPEYMTEFGESLDCVIIGGYYGTGRRGGFLGSFLCGLRVDDIDSQAKPSKKFKSFVKVGGGFAASDYQAIRHHTAGKWMIWDRHNPPAQYILLAGGNDQLERPDEWIRPEDSVVISIKAASVIGADSFSCGFTLRFPRFQTVRWDRDYTTALSIRLFLDLQKEVENERQDKKLTIDESRRRRKKRVRRDGFVVAGQITTGGSSEPKGRMCLSSKVFYVMTESLKPNKLSKRELELLVKMHGGKLVQTQAAQPPVICIAAKDTVAVAALKKRGVVTIIKPKWLLDCIALNETNLEAPVFMLPLEPSHVYWLGIRSEQSVSRSLDVSGDSFARDINVQELREVSNSINAHVRYIASGHTLAQSILASSSDSQLPLNIFVNLIFYLPSAGSDLTKAVERSSQLSNRLICKALTNQLLAGGARKASNLLYPGLTHVIVMNHVSCETEYWRTRVLERPQPFPRLVSEDWVTESWQARTRLDEERFRAVSRTKEPRS